MDNKQRVILLQALSDVRAGLAAEKAGAPVAPALYSIEKRLMTILFTEEEVNEYLKSQGRL